MELHSIASYPITFKQTVISPTKICLQFEMVHVKVKPNEKALLLKRMHDGTSFLPIRTDGQVGDHPHDRGARTATIQCLAVGCQLPVIEALQHALIDAYDTYRYDHDATYRATYHKDFTDFLKDIHARLGQLIDG